MVETKQMNITDSITAYQINSLEVHCCIDDARFHSYVFLCRMLHVPCMLFKTKGQMTLWRCSWLRVIVLQRMHGTLSNHALVIPIHAFMHSLSRRRFCVCLPSVFRRAANPQWARRWLLMLATWCMYRSFQIFYWQHDHLYYTQWL